MSSSDSGSEQSEDGAGAFVDSASSFGRNKRKDAPEDNDGGADENEDAGQAKRQRRTAGSDAEDSDHSTSLSDLDSEGDTPLQELVNGNVRLNSGATAGKGSRTVSSKVSASTKAPTKAPTKAGASTRTVPDHQPSSPHAELHHPPEDEDGSAAKPLDDKQLQDAIAVQVKLEEGLEEAVAPQPSIPVADMVKGPTLVDDSIVNEVKPRERPAQLEERLGVIRFVPVTSSQPSLTTSIVLTGLKNIFQRQLPKMPREYITRLVFDRNHWSVAIVKKGYQVVGGITYRPFEQRTFGEIVFCAITGTEQVRGYGSHLMNHVKDWVRTAHPGIKHFLTYADNYAFGYFKKQGFTKEVTLPRHLWAGYIKDYEGATIMQCTMLPKIKYLEAGTLLLKQKQLILQKIREHSNSHIVHSGRALFGDRTRVDPSEVQALREIGWSPEMDALTRRPERGPQHAIMRRLLTDLQNHPASWAFARPVNPEEVPEYYNTVKTPMDLETMENKLNAGKYDMGPQEDGTPRTPREGLELFLQDTDLIWYNCRIFNAESSNYTKNANKLERFLKERVRSYTTEE